MNRGAAHAREVAAIEAMTVELCGSEPRVTLSYGRSPQVWLDVWPAALKSMRDYTVYGSAWPAFGTPVHGRKPEPQRVMGRPRKVAPKPGRKFSGMTRFSWRQR